MKKILFVMNIAAALSMTSCTDYFLDLKPTDQQTEANFYKNAKEFEAAARSTYSFYAFKDVSATVNGTKHTRTFGELVDRNADLLTGNGSDCAMASGTKAAGTTDAYWSIGYARIRSCNEVLTKGEEYTGSEDITSSLAVAHFFRAYQYFELLKHFGGVPIVTQPLTSASEELYGTRNSRYEVAKLIFDDLDYAIKYLPNEKNYDGTVSKEGAQAFKSRVLLFEATWEKYVGTTTDGDGTKEGAGTAKPEGYPSVESMLTGFSCRCCYLFWKV